MATVINPSPTATGVGVAYHHTDHLGGSSVETDQKGNLVETLDYYSFDVAQDRPFGSVRLDEKTAGYENDYKYTGKELDVDTGLMYYEARYYNAVIGRFVSEDPEARLNPSKFLADPQQFNFYSYALNNPLRYSDPTGETYFEAVKGYCVGLAVSLWETDMSIVNAIAHPVQTAKNISQSAVQIGKDYKQLYTDLKSNPQETISQIKIGSKAYLDEFMQSSDYSKGKTIGKMTEKGMEIVAGPKVAEGLKTGALRQTVLGADRGVQFGNFNLAFNAYSKAKGFGLNLRDVTLSSNLYKQRILGVDFHKFQINGKNVILPHIDTASLRHLPWSLFEKKK